MYKSHQLPCMGIMKLRELGSCKIYNSYTSIYHHQFYTLQHTCFFYSLPIVLVSGYHFSLSSTGSELRSSAALSISIIRFCSALSIFRARNSSRRLQYFSIMSWYKADNIPVGSSACSLANFKRVSCFMAILWNSSRVGTQPFFFVRFLTFCWLSIVILLLPFPCG